MCGRLTLKHPRTEIEEMFAYKSEDIVLESVPQRYNVGPTQPLLTVRNENSQRHLRAVRWGLVPNWVRDPKVFTLLINGRVETVLEKPSFRGSMRHRRCLIPASGYYEWYRSGEQKQPFYIRPKTGAPFAMAGLWDEWSGPDGNLIDSGAVLTQPANNSLSTIHHRMPIIIAHDMFDRWLDVKHIDAKEALGLLEPVRNDFFEAIPVSTKVNSLCNDGPELIEKIDINVEETQKPKASTRQMDLF